MNENKKLFDAYAGIISEQSGSNAESMLGRSTDAVTPGLCWLLMHNFDLDDELYGGYGLTANNVDVNGFKAQFNVEYSYRKEGGSWTIYVDFDGGKIDDTYNRSCRFKFKEGDVIRTDDVIAGMENACSQLKAADIKAWLESQKESDNEA